MALSKKRRNKFNFSVSHLGHFAFFYNDSPSWFFILPTPLFEVRKKGQNMSYIFFASLTNICGLYSPGCLMNSLQLFVKLGCFGKQGSGTPAEPGPGTPSLKQYSDSTLLFMASILLLLSVLTPGYHGNQIPCNVRAERLMIATI